LIVTAHCRRRFTGIELARATAEPSQSSKDNPVCAWFKRDAHEARQTADYAM